MSPGWRLFLLWISQAARVLGDGCLRLVAMLELTGAGESGRLSAFHLTTALFVGPFVLLAPLNGCLSNSLPRRAVLVASAALTLLALLIFWLTGGPWIVCTVVVGAGAALNSAARYAILPAAARDAGVPLPRLSGWIELGAAVAVVASVALGLALPHAGWPADGSPLAFRAVAVLLGLNLLCLLGALPASFPSDVPRPEPASALVGGFVRDLRRIAGDRAAGLSLFALAGFQALVTAGAGALVTDAIKAGQDGLDAMLPAVALAVVGAALGSGAAAFIGHPRRCLGLVPPGAAGLLASLLWAMAVISPDVRVPLIPALLLGFMGGLVNAPLRAAYLAAVPPDARGNGTAVMNTAIYLMTAILTGGVAALTGAGTLTSTAAQLAFLAVLAALGVVCIGVHLFPPFLELLLAGALWPSYRIRGHGPGLHNMPTSGPLIVICNHSAYLDPFWLGKLVPRKLTPMMTSVFYDKPALRWLMRWVVGAIRVQASRFRRDAPELDEAVALLRRGGCLLLFPEAILRRDEDRLLRNFGQGVWRILREAPETPVVLCWLEGGWGSYASYKDGPPFVNKRLDWARRIDIAFAEPAPLPAEVLADQRQTRTYLMRACLACRAHLGLEVPLGVEAEDDLTQSSQQSTGNPHESSSS